MLSIVAAALHLHARGHGDVFFNASLWQRLVDDAASVSDPTSDPASDSASDPSSATIRAALRTTRHLGGADRLRRAAEQFGRNGGERDVLSTPPTVLAQVLRSTLAVGDAVELMELLRYMHGGRALDDWRAVRRAHYEAVLVARLSRQLRIAAAEPTAAAAAAAAPVAAATA